MLHFSPRGDATCGVPGLGIPAPHTGLWRKQPPQGGRVCCCSMCILQKHPPLFILGPWRYANQSRELPSPNEKRPLSAPSSQRASAQRAASALPLPQNSIKIQWTPRSLASTGVRLEDCHTAPPYLGPLRCSLDWSGALKVQQANVERLHFFLLLPCRHLAHFRFSERRRAPQPQ